MNDKLTIYVVFVLVYMFILINDDMMLIMIIEILSIFVNIQIVITK